jgi:transcriptional regulator with XRE-family HTH domain
MSPGSSAVVFGDRLAEERRRLGLTQADLAGLLGVKRSAVAMMETGRSGLEATRVASLRDAGFDVHYLLFGERGAIEFGHGFDWDLFFEILNDVELSFRASGLEQPNTNQMKALVRDLYLRLAGRRADEQAKFEKLLARTAAKRKCPP